MGDQGDEKKLFSRIRRDRVDVLWPILLKRSSDRKHYEISTLKTRESQPSELRFKAFLSINDLKNFESEYLLQNETSATKETIAKAVSDLDPNHSIGPLLKPKRQKLTSEVLNGVKEKKQTIKLEEKEKHQRNEAERRAEKAMKKAKDRENFIKNSGIDISNKPKPKLTKFQIRENKKQHQRELEKERMLNMKKS